METIIENTSGCPAIDQLIESSKILDNRESEQNWYHLRWIPFSEFTDINIESIEHSTNNQPTHYATYERAKNDYTPSYKLVEMLLLGTAEECTQEFIQVFARTYFLPTHKYINPPNMNQYKKYSA